ncbi:acyl carrier protein [Kitasatospora indigofera]|uniref:acyl carrier protein n=1 Tax=Kitasatospora indigofera TaxID=67307 RepID=UPI0036902624
MTAQHHAAVPPAGREGTGEVVRAALAGIRPHHPEDLGPEVRLADLGHDSLDRVILVTALERATGLAIDDGDALAWRTIADITAHLTRLHEGNRP